MLRAYDEAVYSAGGSDLRLHYTLAKELTGADLYSVSDYPRANTYFKIALDVHTQCEAQGKVEHIVERFGAPS